MKRLISVTLVLAAVLFALSAWAGPWRGQGRHGWTTVTSSAAEIKKLVEEEIKTLKPASPYLEATGYCYVVPMLGQDGRAIAKMMVDARSGKAISLPAPRCGSSTQPVKPEVTTEQALKKAKEIIAGGLTVGEIYQNPRGWYQVEIKAKGDQLIAIVRSDGKNIW